jgi:hypothetical protein
MQRDRTELLYASADELLVQAEHEGEKAEEDVITHLICHHSRLALANYLAGFLLRKDVPVHHPVTLSVLLEQCRALDARFDQVDLSPVHCRHETHDFKYCLDALQVDACLRVAQQARNIIKTDSPAY